MVGGWRGDSEEKNAWFRVGKTELRQKTVKKKNLLPQKKKVRGLKKGIRKGMVSGRCSMNAEGQELSSQTKPGVSFLKGKKTPTRGRVSQGGGGEK